MKKFTFTICLIIIAITCRPQAVLEHTYTDEIISGPYKLSNYGWVYASIHYGTMKDNIYIYSQSHSLLKTIPIQLPTNYSFSQLLNVSDELFNSDNNIEVLYSINSINPTNYKLILKNDQGVVLQEFDKQYWARIVNMDGVFKMIGMAIYVDSNTYIYSLPGTMVEVAEPVAFNNDLPAFPNPCSDYLNIPTISYPSVVTILSLTGSAVRCFFIQTPSQSRIDIRELMPGSYIYRIRQQSGTITSGKFTVVR